MLRRAFSIAGMDAQEGEVRLRVIHRVVGAATRWMRGLEIGDPVSVLGPLGNGFPIHLEKRRAWLVAGGVGLPPMLWLAAALHAANRVTVSFCGAQSAELLPLDIDARFPPDKEARSAVFSAREFSRCDTPTVISTDDGSIGFFGHVGHALTAYADANPVDADDLVVYTCGPERMMRFVSEFCGQRGILCYVCMERNMACGLGTCQSCVVPIVEEKDPEGWRYALCCTDGPIFDSRRIIWDEA